MNVDTTQVDDKSTQEAPAVSNEAPELSVQELKELYDQEKAKAARINEQRKEAKERLDALQSQVEQLQKSKKDSELQNLSIEERYKVMVEERESEAKRFKEELEKRTQELQNFHRREAISRLTSDVKFKDDIPSDVRSYAIENSFKGIDIEDVEQLQSAKTALIQRYKSMIAANAPRGGGTQEQPVSMSLNPTKTTNTMTPEQYSALSREERLKISSKDREAIMAQI